MIKLVFSDMTGGIDDYSHMLHELLSFYSKLRRHKIYVVFHTSILPLGKYAVKTSQEKKTVTEYIIIVTLFLTSTIEAITMPFSAECLSYETSIPLNSMQLKC